MSSHTRPSLASPLRVQALGATSRPDLHTRYAACSSRTLFRLCLCKITRVRTWLCSCPSPTCSLTMRLARPPRSPQRQGLVSQAARRLGSTPATTTATWIHHKLEIPQTHRHTPRRDLCKTPPPPQKAGRSFSLSLWRPLHNTPAPRICGRSYSHPGEGNGVRCQSIQGDAGLYPLQGERQIRASSAEIGEGSSAQPTPGYAKVSSKGRGRIGRPRPKSVRGLPRNQLQGYAKVSSGRGLE